MNLESTRIYCCHGYDHLLSVARIAYIRALELGLPYSKQVVYAAALLHDIGKAEQYESGEPHEEVGARFAAQILADSGGFTEDEQAAIVQAVREHRRFAESSSDLGKLLFQADKASRACFACDVRDSCSWPREKMNLEVMI